MDLYSKFYAILWNYTPFFRVKYGIEVQNLRFQQIFDWQKWGFLCVTIPVLACICAIFR